MGGSLGGVKLMPNVRAGARATCLDWVLTMSSRSSRALRWAAALCLMPALAAQAQVFNGGFESGLAGWTTLGDASTQGGTPLGAQQLWLTTASSLYQDDFPAAPGARNRSGNGAADVGVPGGVEAFAGLALGALDPDAPNGIYAYEGSVARQQFVAAAGDRFSFAWDLGTSDTQGDVAFVAIDGVLTVLGASGPTSLAGTLGNTWRTGFSTFSTTFATGGSHTVAFGVVDVGDFSVTSTLAIDGVQIGDVAVVPEPSGALLGLACAGLLAGWVRRRG